MDQSHTGETVTQKLHLDSTGQAAVGVRGGSASSRISSLRRILIISDVSSAMRFGSSQIAASAHKSSQRAFVGPCIKGKYLVGSIHRTSLRLKKEPDGASDAEFKQPVLSAQAKCPSSFYVGLRPSRLLRLIVLLLFAGRRSFLSAAG